MEKNDNKGGNVIKYRRRFRINIGIIVFAFVLVYFLVYLFQYLTENHVTIYEVEKGQIMVNSRYTGLALRPETVTYSTESGKLNYYSKEGEKAGYGDLICSIDTEGSISDEITAAAENGTSLELSDLREVQEIVSNYSHNYSREQFYDVYTFGNTLNSEVQESIYLSALESLGDRTDSSTFTLVTADQDGVLAFYTDGYESVTPENFSADMYQASDYEKVNLNSNTSASPGQALYKTVTDENWYLMIPIDDDTAAMYQAQLEGDEDSFILSVTFKKDEVQTYSTARIQTYAGQNFLELSFNSSMIRYLSDRYLEVELGSGENSGLKIPNSAIVQKEFLDVPEEYIYYDEKSDVYGVNKLYTDKQGTQYEEFVEPDIYYIDEETGDYCIAADELAIGDTILKPDSTGRYILNNTVEHDGVYNLNKGYAVFKLIDVTASNGEYTIVKTGTNYGLSLYDRIALEGDSLEEGEYAT